MGIPLLLVARRLLKTAKQQLDNMQNAIFQYKHIENILLVFLQYLVLLVFLILFIISCALVFAYKKIEVKLN